MEKLYEITLKLNNVDVSTASKRARLEDLLIEGGFGDAILLINYNLVYLQFDYVGKNHTRFTKLKIKQLDKLYIEAELYTLAGCIKSINGVECIPVGDLEEV
jgi:hypothetical protein